MTDLAAIVARDAGEHYPFEKAAADRRALLSFLRLAADDLAQALDRMETAFNRLSPDETADDRELIAQALWFGSEELRKATARLVALDAGRPSASPGVEPVAEPAAESQSSPRTPTTEYVGATEGHPYSFRRGRPAGGDGTP